MNEEEEACGPWVHGAGVILLPKELNLTQVRTAYVEALDRLGLPRGDTPADDLNASQVMSYDSGIALRNAPGGEHTALAISKALGGRRALLVQPLGKGQVWTYVLYVDGHVMDRHASCPEWIPDDYLGDPDFDEYERHHGRAKALRDYMGTWRGNAVRIAELFGADVARVEPYLRQFTSSELSEWRNLRKKYAEHKVQPTDRFSIASPWVLVHFIEQLGFSGFRDDYWFPEARGSESKAIYWPAQHRGPRELGVRPACARDPFPFGGFFWSHQAICET
jgi:hypothetical protein